MRFACRCWPTFSLRPAHCALCDKDACSRQSAAVCLTLRRLGLQQWLWHPVEGLVRQSTALGPGREREGGWDVGVHVLDR